MIGQILRSCGVTRAMRSVPLALAALAVAASDPAAAQRQPYGGYGYSTPGSNYGQTRRVYEAGKFDYYVMSLSWSPSYCAGLARDGYDPQCHSRDGKRFSFVLHGVWPQFEKGWPQDCASADKGFVPRPVANRMLDIMPSDKLVFHEYRKHGTCSGLGVDGYFDMMRSLYNKVKIPQRFVNVTDPRMFVSTQDLLADFIAANPGMKADGIAVECGGPGPRLKEVRICFDKGGNFRSCGRNERQSRMCAAPQMYVPPVREGGPQPRLDGPASGQKI